MVYQSRAVLLTGILLGIGIAGFIDETLLHQLLQWHNFYYYTNQFGRILSDGLFHLFSTALLIWGTFRLWRGRESWEPVNRNRILAVLLIGAGGFNLFDGLIQHLVLRFHLVNELVCTPASRASSFLGICPSAIPFEIVYDLIALVILTSGIVWWRKLQGGVNGSVVANQ